MASINYMSVFPTTSTSQATVDSREVVQPAFLDWWRAAGPQVFKEDDVYLRTAISTQPGGWAHFDYVKMPDYRWGIFLAEQDTDRVIPAGDMRSTGVARGAR